MSETKPDDVEEGPPEQTSTAVATSMTPPNISMHSQEKEGGKCCGCFCDYRRAVVVVAVIFIVLGIANLLGALFQLPVVSIGIDDEEVAEFWEENSLTNQAILSGISIVMGICALVGAKFFNIYLVGINILWLIANYITGVILNLNLIEASNEEFKDKEGYTPYSPTIFAYVIQGIIVILFIYPHVGFIHEVKKGILSQETYPREEFSCCCTDKRR